MNGSRVVAGRRIVGLLRATECGHWYLTVCSDGQLGGGLLLDPALVTGTERLVEEVSAVRAAGLPGVLPVADLVGHEGQVWLFIDTPPGPTVRELLDSGPSRGVDVGSAATLLNETAQTLLALHRADVVHGGFGPSTVAVSADGKAALVEVGLAAAFGLRSVTPGDDVRDWARLAVQLAGEWSGDDGPGADMLTRAAAVADRSDLAEARQVLLAGRDVLAPDFLDRRPLVLAAGQWVEFMGQHAKSATGRSPGELAEAAAGALSEARSLLVPQHVPRPDEPGVFQPVPREPAVGDPPGPDAEATRVEPKVGAQLGGGQPMWREERPAGQRLPVGQEAGDRGAGSPAGRFRDPVPPQRAQFPRRTVAVAAAVVAVIAAGLFWWQQRGDDPGDLVISGVSVQPVEGEVGCDADVEVVGVIATNGGGGEVRYRWVRNDGNEDQPSEVYRVTIPSGTTEQQVFLRWRFEGRATLDMAATLEVLEPSTASGETSFTYACG